MFALDPGNKQRYKAREQEWKAVAKNERLEKKKQTIESQIAEVIYVDAMEEWVEVQNVDGSEVEDLKEFTVNGMTYKVDGENVKLDYSVHEKDIAKIIAEKYGKEVKMIPKVGNPKGVKTPDYLINGERYDLKTIKTAGKNTFYNRLKDSKGQAESFILDLSENKLLDEEIIRQIEYVFISNHTRFVKMIVIMKNQKVVKAFKRKK